MVVEKICPSFMLILPLPEEIQVMGGCGCPSLPCCVFSNGFQVSSKHRAEIPLEVKIPISATWSTLENFSDWKMDVENKECF